MLLFVFLLLFLCDFLPLFFFFFFFFLLCGDFCCLLLFFLKVDIFRLHKSNFDKNKYNNSFCEFFFVYDCQLLKSVTEF